MVVVLLSLAIVLLSSACAVSSACARLPLAALLWGVAVLMRMVPVP